MNERNDDRLERIVGFRIEAPHFVAGGEASNGVCVRVAPIIKYMVGWTGRQVCNYCRKKAWKVEANAKHDSLAR